MVEEIFKRSNDLVALVAEETPMVIVALVSHDTFTTMIALTILTLGRLRHDTSPCVNCLLRWALPGSNRRLPRYERGVLPTELKAHFSRLFPVC